MEGRGYNLTVFNMVRIKLKNRQYEPMTIRRGGVIYTLTTKEEVDIPLRYATQVIDPSVMEYTLTPADKPDLASATGTVLRVILKLENATSTDDIILRHFPKRLSKVKAKKEEPKVEEESKVEEEPKVEEKVEEKPKPKRKPRATTQSKAEDKPAPKRKPRATKKKADESPSTPKTKKTKKTTTKEE